MIQSAFSRQVRWTLRQLRRWVVAIRRMSESASIFLGGMPWKIERFNRLIEPEIARAVTQIGSAEAIVGIAFYKEKDSLAAVVHKAQADLEARGERAAIVIVGELKTLDMLLSIDLPASTGLVRVVRFAKPFGFGQRPGLSRRSWSHWAMFRVSGRLNSDVAFIDADVRNTEGWVDLYLRAIRDGRADIAVASYIRSFGSDDGIVHLWDRLIFGAPFGRWIEFRQGGDYAVSRRVVPEVLKDPMIMREGAYTLDSAVMALVASAQGKIELVSLGYKEHEPLDPQRLFKRLPDLVRSVFDDIQVHLPALLGIRRDTARSIFQAEPARDKDRAMQDLIGDRFREELYRDLLQRSEASSGLIRRTLGKTFFRLWMQHVKSSEAERFELSAKEWARATFRFLTRYLWRTPDEKDKLALATAYVPLLEAGVLGFLNRTASLRYGEAMEVLEAEYLPFFLEAWRALSRRRIIHRIDIWRRWPARLRFGSGARARFEAILPR